MYIPRPFAVGPDQARELLGELSLGHLVTAGERGIQSTLIPWELDSETFSLIGHMARPNLQWQTPWYGQALVIFEGSNGYVSPSWYASKAEHGRVVPTWDYVLVHAYGDLVVHDDAGWVEVAVSRVTDHHEQNRPDPWGIDDAPRAYIEGQLRGIVGIELRIERVEASVKMSQNKSAADAAGVVAGLRMDGHDQVAEWVGRSRSLRRRTS